jgi:hypothetical protein
MSNVDLETPSNFEDAWPWMPTFRRILRTVSEPRLAGAQIFSASDFSGSHKSSRHHVYGFVLVDPAESAQWFTEMRRIRRSFLDGRRMSFKALNDGKRQKALIPFLEAAELLRGVCCVIAVTKKYQHMATSPFTVTAITAADALEGKWNGKSFETAMRAVLLWSVLLSEVGSGQQHVTWVVDEDEIAANDLRHTDLLQLAGRVSRHIVRRKMGELCVCTTGSEGANIAFEDFTAIPDLAAGAFCEAVNKWNAIAAHEPEFDGKYELTNSSGKSDLINDWFFFASRSFRRVAVLLDEQNGRNVITRITLEERKSDITD